MTKEELDQVESSQRQHFEVLLHQDKQALIVEQLEMNLFAMLKPKVSIDGNQYCVLYGEDLRSGICGFGDTLMLAIYDFNKQFHKPIIKSAIPGAAGNSSASTPAQQSYDASSEQPAP